MLNEILKLEDGVVLWLTFMTISEKCHQNVKKMKVENSDFKGHCQVSAVYVTVITALHSNIHKSGSASANS